MIVCQRPNTECEVFALGWDAVLGERGRCPCLRVNVLGVRKVLMTTGGHLKAFMQASGISTVAPETQIAFFKNMSKDVLTKYAQEYDLFHVTVNPGEALITPFDTIYLEMIGKEADVCGFRICCFFKSDADLMDATSRWCISAKKPNAFLQNACEVLSLMDMD